jgi:hypothetical protein
MSSVVISGDTSGSITLQAPAVAGTTTLNLPAATGTVMVSGNMPAFRAVLITSNQVITNSVTTKIGFNSVATGNNGFDTNSNYNTSTFRFQPTVAGYYQLNSFIETDTFLTGGITIYIYKTGNPVSYVIYGPNTTNYPSASISDILYANGSSDYFEIYLNQNSGSNKNVYAGSAPAYTWFSGCLVRAA